MKQPNPQHRTRGVPNPRVAFSWLSLILLAACSLLFLAPTNVSGQAAFNNDNLAIVVAAASASNTTADVREITKTGTLVQTINIPGTGTDAIRVSGSATSTMYASNSNDGSLFCFTGHNSTNTGSNVNTLQTNKAVVTLNNSGTISLATLYNGTGTNQTRGATTLDNTNYFIGDQGGFYTNSSTTPSPSGNIRSVKSFGGTVYAFVSSASLPPVGIISAPSGGTYTALTGLANGNTSRQDFYLISSGSNGSSFDVLYVLDASSATVGTIFKYSLVAGSWTANGSYLTTVGGFGMYAEKNGANVDIYITTGTGATTANSIRKITDGAGYNTTINVTSASTIYTAPSGLIIKGIARAPQSLATPILTISNNSVIGGFTTTYGTPSAAQSFDVEGVDLTTNLVITAPSGFQVSTNIAGPYNTTVSLTPTAGVVSTTTIYARLAGTATVAGSPYSGNITATSTGATTQNINTNGGTVAQKGVTFSGATAQNKIYDGNNTATISGVTVNGAENSDVLTATGGGTFAQISVGNNIVVTATLSVSGTNASSYSVTAQPSGLEADITEKELTVSGLTAQNKTFDNNTSATITGTPSLVGVVGADVVSITGTPLGTFANVGPSTNIIVTVSGLSLTGADAGNYTLTQPTLSADINPSVTPVITVGGALSAVNTTYGNASPSPSSFTVEGVDLLGDITVTAPTGFEVSTSIASGYDVDVILTPTAGTVANTTIYVRLAATATVAGSPYSGMIVCTSPSATSQNVATASSTVSAKEITISGAIAQNKEYNGNNVATVTGATHSGEVNGDVLTLSAAGALFAQATVGTGISVNTNYSVTGTNASSYFVTQPIGLMADITAKELTITGITIDNKVFDGNTNATISGTASLVGVVGGDVVTLDVSGATASFNDASIGNAKAVTVSGYAITGADAGNYSLIQPSGLTANITAPIIAQWTLENSPTASSPAPSTGTGTASTVGSMGTLSLATGMNTLTGCGTQTSGTNAWAFSAVNPGASNESSGAQFTTSTLGYENISFSWEQRWSGTSTNTVRLQYTTDGSTWNNFTMTDLNTQYCLGSLNDGRFETNTTSDQFRRITVDLSSITAANNNVNFGVRVVAAHYQSTGQFRQVATPTSVATAGTWRFDNITFRGEPVAGSTASVISNGTGSSSICIGSSANVKIDITGGVSPYTVVISDGSTQSTVTSYVSGTDITVSPLANATYTLVSVTDANNDVGSGNSGSAAITVSASIPSVVNTYSATKGQADGTTVYYTDGSCNLLATIEDQVGGNVLGSTTVSSELLSSNLISNNNGLVGQVYMVRNYAITPSSSGTATITFLVPQADFTAYNASNGSLLDMPTSGSNADPNIANIRLAKVTGGTLTTGTFTYPSISVNWNNTDSRWEILTTTDAEGLYYFFTDPACNTVISGLGGTPTANSVNLTWTAAPGATSYDVRYRAIGAATWQPGGSTTGTTMTVNGLLPGTNYETQIKARCTPTTSGLFSTSFNFTTDAAPCGTAATVITPITVTNNSATITWNAVSGVSTYWVEFKQSAAINWSTWSTTSTSLVLTGLLPNTNYDVRIRNTCATGGGISAPSTTENFTTSTSDCITTPAAINTPITPGSTSATISWSAVSGTATYWVNFKPTSGSTWTTWSTSSTSMNLTNLIPGTQYDVRVMNQCTGGGFSGFSTVEQFTTTANPCITTPADINTPITAASTSATISWSAVSGTATYWVFFKPSASSTWSTWSTTSTSINLTGLQPNTQYDVRMMNQCTGGGFSALGTMQQFTTTANTCISTPVTINTPITTTQNSATITWNSVAGVASYSVQFKTVAASTWSTPSTSNTSFILSNLLPGTTYQVRIMNICTGGGFSAFSATQEFTTASAKESSSIAASIFNFIGETKDNANVLTWSTISEENISGFNVLNSTDGVRYEPIATISSKADNGSSEEMLHYSFVHESPSATTNYYRIESVAFDNTVMLYNRVVTLNNQSPITSISLYPNPTRDIVTIDMTAATEEALLVKVIDMTGRVVKVINTKTQKGQQLIPVSLSEYSSGIYTIQVMQGAQLLHVGKVQKQD